MLCRPTSQKTNKIQESQISSPSTRKTHKIVGRIDGLLYEGMIIQQRLRCDKKGLRITKI